MPRCPTPYTPHHSHYALHPTLHPTPYTLHPTPVTLHPTLYTLNPKLLPTPCCPSSFCPWRHTSSSLSHSPTLNFPAITGSGRGGCDDGRGRGANDGLQPLEGRAVWWQRPVDAAQPRSSPPLQRTGSGRGRGQDGRRRGADGGDREPCLFPITSFL